MRTLITTFAVLVSAGTLCAQGTVNFINAGAPVWHNFHPIGSTYLGQLYASATDNLESFQPVGVPVAFRNNSTTGLGTGIVSGGVVTIPASIIATPGGSVWLQLRAWSAAGGTYEQTLASGNGSFSCGAGNPFYLATTGNPTTIPPGTPAVLTGLMPFDLNPLPEPCTTLLASIGLLLLLCRGRRSE